MIQRLVAWWRSWSILKITEPADAVERALIEAEQEELREHLVELETKVMRQGLKEHRSRLWLR